MRERSWIDHLRESFAAIAAGAQAVPMGDNGELHHSLAVRLAQMRADAVAGRWQRGARVRNRADGAASCH